MSYIDPLKVVRNPETLQAYRRYRREMWATAAPWVAIAVVAALTEIGLFLYWMLWDRFRDASLISGLLLLAFGLSYAIASVRMWRFRRSRPFELP
jgi:hypothetical protein